MQTWAWRSWWLAASWLVGAVWAGAAQLAPIFGPLAVLQRDQPIAVWGTGTDGETVTVELLGATATATVQGGRWQATLPPQPAHPGTTLRLRATDTGRVLAEVAPVAVGEVWLCTGQSNMDWRLNQCSPYSDALLATANNPRLRQLKVPLRPYVGDPLPPLSWKPFDRANAGHFSAVATYFAARVQQHLGNDVVIGLVNCAFGGTPIEAWMSRAALVEAGAEALLTEHARKAAAYPTPEAYDAAWAAFQAERRAWEDRRRADPASAGPAPTEPYGYRTKGRPTGLYDSMFGVIRPYAARGVLWYQGENNAGRNLDYARLLSVLRAELWADWAQPQWPFYILQLASPTANWPDAEDGYAVIREAQRAVALADPHSGLVVTLDYGERGDVHPPRKQEVGERLARLALVRAYGQTALGAAQSPTATVAVRLDATTVAVHFADLPGRLDLRDPTVPTLETVLPTGEAVAVAATVSASGQQLDVTVPAGAVALRYGWRNFGPLSLYADDGLPVSPFRLSIGN